MRRSLFAFIGLAILASFPAQAQKYNLTLTGASPGGLWSRIGGGIDAAVAAAYPGSTVTYQTSSGGLANIPLVASGKVPMGLATDGELTLAWTGQKPYKAPIENVRTLLRVYTPAARFQATHLLLNQSFANKHGIKSFADIVSKKAPLRVAVNRRGNMDGDVSLMVMGLMGASQANIKNWGGQIVRAASKEIVSLMLDRRIDMANFGIAYKHPRVREIAKGVSPVLLDIPRGVAEKTAKKLGGEVCIIKPGEYKFAPKGATSICIGALVVVSNAMNAKTAYNLAKGIFGKIEVFKNKSHRLIKKTATPKTMATPSVAPFHPGAAKYLKEAGLL